MKQQEKIKFFNETKGKKIRWSGWANYDWFIPTKLLNPDKFAYDMEGKNSEGKRTWYYIYDGFEPSRTNEKWEFYKE